MSVRSSGDHFFANDRPARIECCIRRPPFATFSLVPSPVVVLIEPLVEVPLELLDRLIDLLAERHAIELIEHRFVEAFADAVRLRALYFRLRVLDVVESEVELVLMPFRVQFITLARLRAGRIVRPESFTRPATNRW